MRARSLYGYASGRQDYRRHLIRATGPDGIPRGLCEDPIALRDDSSRPVCPECRLVALTELSLALGALRLPAEAAAVARHVNDTSYETQAAQTA